jgi:hypothetical protein
LSEGPRQSTIALLRPGTVALTYNPSYLGGWDWKEQGSRPAWANCSQEPAPHLQNNQSKMNCRCDSSGRASALQVCSPEFNPSPTKKKNLSRSVCLETSLDHSLAGGSALGGHRCQASLWNRKVRTNKKPTQESIPPGRSSSVC